MEYRAFTQTFGPDPGRTLSAGIRGILQRDDGISYYKEVPVCWPTPGI